MSKSANILTGWEVTLDLIRKLAELSKEPCETSPEQWYHQKYGKDPNYSDLLEKLLRTPTERQKLLSGYFERHFFQVGLETHPAAIVPAGSHQND